MTDEEQDRRERFVVREGDVEITLPDGTRLGEQEADKSLFSRGWDSED